LRDIDSLSLMLKKLTFLSVDENIKLIQNFYSIRQ